jgi:proteic killer suppression protein
VRFAFAKKNILQLYTDRKGARKYPAPVVDAFFKAVAMMSAAKDERDLYSLKSSHFEKLKGKRRNQHSVRLNDQFRLIVQLEQDKQGTFFLIVDIEDYH